jgi:hypothetical protein
LAYGEQVAVGLDWVNTVLVAAGALLCWTWGPLAGVFWVSLALRLPLTTGDPSQQARTRLLMQSIKRAAWVVVSFALSFTPNAS